MRKTVTVLFCDVADSTALGESTDPEALRVLLARYFEQMKGIVHLHGGTVEKFIGDAVMAVFGIPVSHEDDALRACRAAVEMREAFPNLGITVSTRSLMVMGTPSMSESRLPPFFQRFSERVRCAARPRDRDAGRH